MFPLWTFPIKLVKCLSAMNASVTTEGHPFTLSADAVMNLRWSSFRNNACGPAQASLSSEQEGKHQVDEGGQWWLTWLEVNGNQLQSSHISQTRSQATRCWQWLFLIKWPLQALGLAQFTSVLLSFDWLGYRETVGGVKKHLLANESLARCYVGTSYPLRLAWCLNEGGTKVVRLLASSGPL